MKQLVRDRFGDPLLCCWDDCGQWGDGRVYEVAKSDGKQVIYIFCVEGHRDFWRHSIHDNGNHSPGSRTPSGLIIPS